jgi:hypothetical protein
MVCSQGLAQEKQMYPIPPSALMFPPMRGQTSMMHFRSLMNDYHLKDLSNKVKAVFSAKIQRHGLLTGKPPIGYTKDPNDVQQYA